MKLFKGFIMLSITILPTVGVSQTLSLNEFLTLQLESHYQVWKQEVQVKEQQLALHLGEEYWQPNVTAISSWQQSHTEDGVVKGSIPLDSNSVTYDQWEAGIESTWTSDIGTQVSLNVSHINGEGLGSTALANRQKSEKVTMTLSQPLLKNNTPKYVRIKKYLAENTWQQFVNAQHLTQLEVLRDAFASFLDYQVAYENFRIQQGLLVSIKKSTFLVKRLYAVDKATAYEYQQAKLKLAEQQAQVDGARTEVTLLQAEALLTLKTRTLYQLVPYLSLATLNKRLLPEKLVGIDIKSHPEYLAVSLKYDASLLAYQKQADSLKPDLDLFYQHEKNIYEISADTDVNTYGIRFSYLITNKSTEQAKEALSASVEDNEIEQVQTLKKLQLHQQNFRDRIGYLVSQVAVLKQQVDLAKKGLDQQFERYKVGNASYFSLEDKQQDLLDKQVDWLQAQKTLSSALIQLFYLSQVDVRKVL